MYSKDKELEINSDIPNIRKNYYAKVKITNTLQHGYVNLIVEEKIAPNYTKTTSSACLSPDEIRKLRDMLINICPLSAVEQMLDVETGNKISKPETLKISNYIGNNYVIGNNDSVFYLQGSVAYPVKISK